MDFSLSEEQRLLSETIDRFLAEEAHFSLRKAALHSAAGWSQARWAALAELGVPSTVLRELDGGLGGGAVELALLCRSAGSALLLEPLGSALVGNAAFARYAGAEQRAALAAGLADGSSLLVPVISDPDAVIHATSTDRGMRLQGRAKVVYHAPCATHFLCVLTHAESRAHALACVPANSPGLALHGHVTLDGQPAADLHFDAVEIPPSALWETADTDAAAWLEDLALLALAADGLGSAERSIALTLDYLKTRQQFGGPIGRFQALQHRFVECLSRVEELRTWLWVCAARFHGPAPERRAAVAALKVLLCETARHLGEEAVQMHGGMGVTEDMEISHHFRRLVAATLRYGGRDAHLARYADLTIA